MIISYITLIFPIRMSLNITQSPARFKKGESKISGVLFSYFEKPYMANPYWKTGNKSEKLV